MQLQKIIQKDPTYHLPISPLMTACKIKYNITTRILIKSTHVVHISSVVFTFMSMCMCMCVSLCDFMSYIALCIHPQGQDTKDLYQHKGPSCCPCIVTPTPLSHLPAFPLLPSLMLAAANLSPIL